MSLYKDASFQNCHMFLLIWCTLQTMCFHLGMTEGFIWDYGSPGEKWTEWSETGKILKEIQREFVKDDGAIQYSHKVGQQCYSK